jgi:hypothetical protein
LLPGILPREVDPFVFTPEINSISKVTFSSKFDTEEELLANIKNQSLSEDPRLGSLNEKLAELRSLSGQSLIRDEHAPNGEEEDEEKAPAPKKTTKKAATKAKPKKTTAKSAAKKKS